MINKYLLKLASMSMQRVLMLAVVVAGLYYAVFYDDGSSIEQQITTVQAQLTEEEMKSKESDVAIKELELVRSSVSALNEQFKRAAQQLPSDIQTSEILRTIDTLAKSAGVSIKSKEPSATKREDILELLPLRVVIHGTFSEITMFLYYISSMERITRIMSYSLHPPDITDTNKYKPGTLIFDGQIASFRYLPSEKPSLGQGESKK